MASIEASTGDSCEGALYTLTPQGYEELWRSEGGAMERPGYEELVVTAEAGGESVQAITLRAASLASSNSRIQPPLCSPADHRGPSHHETSSCDVGTVDAPGSRRASKRAVQEADCRRRQRGGPPVSASASASAPASLSASASALALASASALALASASAPAPAPASPYRWVSPRPTSSVSPRYLPPHPRRRSPRSRVRTASWQSFSSSLS
jgi:hypothetical protein